MIYLKIDIRFNKGLNVPSFNVFSEGLYPVTEKIKGNTPPTRGKGHLNLVIPNPLRRNPCHNGTDSAADFQYGTYPVIQGEK